MHRSAKFLPFLALFLAAPLSAQSQDGHVYNVLWFDAHTGEQANYNRAYREVTRPLLDYLKEQGVIVSYLDLVKNTGSENTTNMLLVEFPSWEAFGRAQQMFDEAARAVFGRSFAEVQAERFTPFREPRGSEIYTAPPPSN